MEAEVLSIHHIVTTTTHTVFLQRTLKHVYKFLHEDFTNIVLLMLQTETVQEVTTSLQNFPSNN
jgi:hypothetical protein